MLITLILVLALSFAGRRVPAETRLKKRLLILLISLLFLMITWTILSLALPLQHGGGADAGSLVTSVLLVVTAYLVITWLIRPKNKNRRNS